ncbi:unnamed protein product [Closterium sp. Naga37s-1]|nr:unnamed protein product [Closterium sp. Naga37s-1]
MASAKGVLRNVQAQEEASPHSPREGGVLRNDELARQLEQLKDIDALQALAHSMAAGGKEGSSVLTAAQLGEVISALQAQVQAEVATHHDDLLQQLSSLKDTEGVLSVVRAGVDSLLASVQRVRAEIADPYRAIQVKTRQLAALYDTMELLRAVIKYLKLVRKLREHLSGGVEKAELGKAGQVWQEVGAVHREAQLGGVHVVEAQHEWVAEAGQAIRREAMRALEGGMEAMNQAEVGSVLQVFFNMGELRQTVDQLVAKHKGQAMRAVATGLDMKAISASMGASGGGGGLGGSVGGPGGGMRSGTPPMGGAPRAREALWQRLTGCLDELARVMVLTWHLQRVMAKKRDPISHVVFLDHVLQSGDLLPTERVWEALLRAFSSQLRATFTASSFVKETFVSAYPRLLASLESFLDRLQADTDVRILGGGGGGLGGGAGGAGGGGFGLGAVGGGSVVAGSWANGGTPAVISVEHRAQMLAALEPFQTAYLALSLSRMTDPINTMMPAAGGGRGGVPGPEGGGLLRLVLANAGKALQLLAERCEYQGLLRLVLANAGKALQLLAERCEYQVCVGWVWAHVCGNALFWRMHATRCMQVPVCSTGSSALTTFSLYPSNLSFSPLHLSLPVPNLVKSWNPARQRSSATSPCPESRQVLAPCSPAQQRNISLCVLLGAVHTRCMQLLARLPEEADCVMEAGVGSVHGVAMDAVAPLFKAMRDRIEACLLQIHQQDFSSDDPNAPPSSTTPPPRGSASRNRTSSSGGSTPPHKHNQHNQNQQQQHESAGDNCSPYMENTIRAITHFHSEFLSKLLLPDSSSTSSFAAAPASSIFAASLSGAAGSGPLSPSTALPPATVSEPVAQSLAKRLASRTLLFFVRHASLVRPLSEAGRLRLARDMGELEFAVGQHLFPTHALGASYRALRAFRPLLFVDLEKIPTSSLLQGLLPRPPRLPPAAFRGPGEDCNQLAAAGPPPKRCPAPPLLPRAPEMLSPFTCSLPHYNFPPSSPPDPPTHPPRRLLRPPPKRCPAPPLLPRAPEMLSPFTCSLPHYYFPPSPPGPPYSPPQDLPPSVALHHLFSRAPPELLSPFTRIQQPPARYSLWLDQHSQQQEEQLLHTTHPLPLCFCSFRQVLSLHSLPLPPLALPLPPPQDLPPSVVLHHLFSRAPPELLSPFTRIQQPPARYSLWLDQHSQQQAWQGIKASLDDYVGSVKARGGKEFHPVYAVMLQLGQMLLVGGNEGK